MNEPVQEAIEEIRHTWPDAAVTAKDDGDGGAYVRIEPIDPGAPYVQRETWIGFRITAQYPYADVYPLFVRADLARTDGQPLGDALTPGSFDGETAIQVSRKQNHLDPNTDTAAIKVLKVIRWLASR
jgi:hypothetical protein